jgi:hypothetical protein
MTKRINIVSSTAIRALIVAGIVSIAASQGAWASGFASHATVRTATLTGVASRATFANNPVVQPPRQFPSNPGKVTGSTCFKCIPHDSYEKFVAPVYHDVLAPVGGGIKTGAKAVGGAAKDVYHFVGGLF